MALFLAGVRLFFPITTITMCVLLLHQLSMAVSHIRRRRDESDQVLLTNRAELRARWFCNTPKPQLIYLTDVYPNLWSSEHIWIPPAVVLHRCDKSFGCCPNYPAEKCEADQEQTVSVVFKKATPTTTTYHHVYERLNFQNHTRCSCKPR